MILASGQGDFGEAGTDCQALLGASLRRQGMGKGPERRQPHPVRGPWVDLCLSGSESLAGGLGTERGAATGETVAEKRRVSEQLR